MPRFLFRTRGLMGLVVACALFCGVVPLTRGILWQQRTICRVYCAHHLAQIGQALQQYHAAHGCFPPAYVTDAQGKSLYSWRVLILPYMDAPDIYNAFNFSQPWNGPDNLQYSRILIKAFTCPDSTAGTPGRGWTNYVVVTGPGTAFPGATTTSRPQFHDGPDTILVTEVAGGAINWAEPRDLNLATMQTTLNGSPQNSISSDEPGGPLAVMRDGEVRRLKPGMSPVTLRALLTIRGGERIEPGSW